MNMKLRTLPKKPVVVKTTTFDGDPIIYNEQKEKIKYSKKKVLSGYQAYIAMIKFMTDYIATDPGEDIGEYLTRMMFDGDDTHYSICWEMWEKTVNEILKNNE